MEDNILGPKLSDLIDRINKLLRKPETSPQQRKTLRKLLAILYMLWDEVVREEIARNTADYQAATAALNEANSSAVNAIEDINETAESIEKIRSAVKAVDKILGVISSII